MPDRTRIVLEAAARALDEVVAPAIDPNQQLATEQVSLVARWLRIIATQHDYAHTRNRFELSHHVELAEVLRTEAELVGPQFATALADAVDRGRRALEDPATATTALNAACTDLAAEISVLVRAASSLDLSVSRRVDSAVLRLTAAYLAVQRAWLKDQRWDPDPGAVASLTDLLTADASTSEPDEKDSNR